MMAKVHALREYTDSTGAKHAIGDEFDLPRNTDREKVDFDRLIEYGVVATGDAPTETKPAPEEAEQRTPPRERKRT